MPNGTQINEVFASRIHKSNASDVLRDAQEMLQHYRDKLLQLATATPRNMPDDFGGTEPWHDYVLREVKQMWGELQDEWWKEWAAGYIVESPECCKDELVDADWENETERGTA